MSLIAGVAAGAVLASLVWLFAQDAAPASIAAQPGTLQSPASAADCPPTPACPPAPTCSPAPRETDSAQTDKRELEPERALVSRTPGYAPGFPVQAALSEAMTAAKVRASFDLDCTARPCLAVFADRVPSEQERSAVIQALLEANPGVHVTSTTILHEAGGESWVLGLADEEPTREEQALVNLRVEELLP